MLPDLLDRQLLISVEILSVDGHSCYSPSRLAREENVGLLSQPALPVGQTEKLRPDSAGPGCHTPFFCSCSFLDVLRIFKTAGYSLSSVFSPYLFFIAAAGRKFRVPFSHYIFIKSYFFHLHFLVRSFIDIFPDMPAGRLAGFNSDKRAESSDCLRLLKLSWTLGPVPNFGL